MSEACWEAATNRSFVTKGYIQHENLESFFKLLLFSVVGKHFETMGHMDENRLMLNSEETLFLMECNLLELKFDGVIVSIQVLHCNNFVNNFHPHLYKKNFSKLSAWCWETKGHLKNILFIQYYADRVSKLCAIREILESPTTRERLD